MWACAARSPPAAHRRLFRACWCCPTTPSRPRSKARSSRARRCCWSMATRTELIPVQALFHARAGPGGAGGAGRVAHVARRRPRHRPGGPAPRRRISGQAIRPDALIARRLRTAGAHGKLPETALFVRFTMRSRSLYTSARAAACGVRRSDAYLGAEDAAFERARIAGNGFPALVLNADFRPLSYYPLSLWSWQDTIKAVFLDRVNIVEEYDHAVRSPTFEMRLPSVVSLKTYVKPSSHPAFTRFNVFLRDRFSCQYCGSRDDLTFDHLIPRSRGGQTTWDNVVAACSPCNLRKGNLTPAGSQDVAVADAVAAVGAAPAPQRPAVPAELSARQLARLSLLGHRARSVERTLERFRVKWNPLRKEKTRLSGVARALTQINVRNLRLLPAKPVATFAGSALNRLRRPARITAPPRPYPCRSRRHACNRHSAPRVRPG